MESDYGIGRLVNSLVNHGKSFASVGEIRIEKIDAYQPTTLTSSWRRASLVQNFQFLLREEIF